MKKVLFLMCLLFLGLGTANLNAQVRIGGNTAPNAAAALDLNATDAINNGTKGLALPRVNLTSNTMQLTTGVVNLTGMLVYNTTATLGAIGIYYWNGATWVKASLPSTSAADSGKILMSNGTQWIAVNNYMASVTAPDSVHFRNLGTVTWTKVLDTTINITPTGPGQLGLIPATGMGQNDFCMRYSGGVMVDAYYVTSNLQFYSTRMNGVNTVSNRIKCYRPSM